MLKRWWRRLIRLAIFFSIVLFLGFCLPERLAMPVKDATPKDWHEKSFWYYPWGSSGVHRGVDIFAPNRQLVQSATDGIVIYAGVKSKGGHVVIVLGPKWRVHYYAHLSKKTVRVGYPVAAGDTIGLVGSSGNAVGKQPHLHYSITTLIPYIWRSDKTPYGSQKKWYINPIPRLLKAYHANTQ